jgi:O-antigen ligase
MNHILLFLLFLVLYSIQTLSLDLSLAPGLSVKNAFLYLIFVLLAIQIAVTQQRRLELMSVLGPFALYVGYAIFMWIVAIWVMEYPGYNVRQSLISLKNGPVEDLIVMLIFFYALAGTGRALWVVRNMMWVIIVGNVITIVDALNIVDLGLIHLRDDGRVGGPIGQSNQFAAFMALCLPIIAALYWVESGFKKFLAGVGFIVSALAFFMAASRAGIAGLIGGGLLGAMFMRRMVPPQLVIRTGVVAVTLIAVSLAALLAAGYGELLLARFDQFEGNPGEATSGRSVIWARLLGMMLEYPLSFVTGFGWSVYQTYLNMGFFRLSPHNTYLNILFNLGIIGLISFLAILVNVLRSVRAAAGAASDEARPFLVAFVIGFLALLVALLFGELYAAWLYIWAIVGITLRIAVSEVTAHQELHQRVPTVGQLVPSGYRVASMR